MPISLTDIIPSSSGGGRDVASQGHSSGALNITRTAVDQTAIVTVNGNITGFTDNLQEGDLLWVILKGNGGSTNYTANLSAIMDITDLFSTGGGGADLPVAFDIFPNTEATVLIRKVATTLYGNLDVLVVGAAAAGPPTVPQNVAATPGDTLVDVTWSAPSSDGGATITDYQVRHSTDESNWTTTADLGSGLSHQVTGLTNTTLYYFQVRAKNSAGYGPWSASTTATPDVQANASVRGSYVSGQVAAPTVSASSLSTTPQNGDGILFIAVAPGPSGSGSVTYTAPSGATQLVDYGGNSFSPRFRAWTKTYAGEANWTFGSDSSITRLFIVAIENGTSFVAGTPTNALDPAGVAMSAGGLGIYLGATNFSSSDTWTAPPTGHTTLQTTNAAGGSNQLGIVASIDVASAQTYDPDAATFSAGGQFSAVAIGVTA